ncbi:MAG: FRG domain-containing protein [Planctomycetota bacterium]|jgi:hypothetical protein
MPENLGYQEVQIKSWEDYQQLVDSETYSGWGFRGHSDATWPLFSSLSRYLRENRVHLDAWKNQEARILRLFKAKAHLYLDHVPADDDAYQWLGLMQHHGAPTRLLDITWSPYVALFFALERATKPAAVWAFFEPKISDCESVVIRGGVQINPSRFSLWRRKVYEEHYLSGRQVFATISRPKIMNRRLIAQSGSFIVPSVLNEPIEDILRDYESSSSCLRKLVIDTQLVRKTAMKRLYAMNITNASLFPDLDGLAKSLAYELEYHWGFDTENMTPNQGFPQPSDLRSWMTKPLSIYPMVSDDSHLSEPMSLDENPGNQ